MPSINSLLTEIANGWPEARNETFTDHPLANKLRVDLKSTISSITSTQFPTLIIKASAGAGNWANVPWLSLLDPQITTSTQSGIYPVYLFRGDGTGLYLSLGFGSTNLKSKFGQIEAKVQAAQIKDGLNSYIPELKNWNDTIDLRSTTNLGRSYEWATAGAKFYDISSMPSDEQLAADLIEILTIYSKVRLTSKETKKSLSKLLDRTSISKPFLLLAGISGTGKTRFVREQAKDSGSLKETYSLVSVRPDWHEPSDLLGYVSRLKDKAEYVSTDVVEFIARAWRAIIDSDLVMSEQTDEKTGDIKLVVQGDSNALGAISPYWLCLDEMNLAPVEQYFADYLSVIETREWKWTGGDFTYGCDALLSASTINNSDYSVQLRKQLGFEDTKYDNSWQLFKKHGISIPFNLIVAGTVNMDETTHGFSRKVLDRALSFDFGEFFPNEIDDFFEQSKIAKSLSYPIYSQAKLDQLESIQADNVAQKTTAFFKSINGVLKGTAFELAFRAFNELCLSVISFAPENDDQLAAVFDDFLMCKVLPRIEGDEDKLTTAQGEPLLPKLNEVIATELTLIWEGQRLDYFRQLKHSDDKAIKVNCRSKVKLERMQSQLDTGFTSFWP
ncbi:DUF3578 domain-containing protein [Shewanella sp.]|uniref:MrcB family domain-containing protein n=1 Tax=Shewanella sp. TaxID=50422 RepID=UPI00258D3C93|nr:DUF3578 domain-containing protein [Shewanella sp.]MCJ8301879.1 DUF3578 domain-containing protein [Shewanella sp.]